MTAAAPTGRRRADPGRGRDDRAEAVEMHQAPSTCLVAVDGSDASVQALVWGLRRAADHAMTVQVLTVWPSHGSALIREVPGHFCYARWAARSAQEDSVRRALDEVEAVPAITTRLENAEVSAAITDASARSALLVLGSGSSPAEPSLTRQLLDRAGCEVVVVDASGAVVTATGRLRDRS